MFDLVQLIKLFGYAFSAMFFAIFLFCYGLFDNAIGGSTDFLILTCRLFGFTVGLHLAQFLYRRIRYREHYREMREYRRRTGQR